MANKIIAGKNQTAEEQQTLLSHKMEVHTMTNRKINEHVSYIFDNNNNRVKNTHKRIYTKNLSKTTSRIEEKITINMQKIICTETRAIGFN